MPYDGGFVDMFTDHKSKPRIGARVGLIINNQMADIDFLPSSFNGGYVSVFCDPVFLGQHTLT